MQTMKMVGGSDVRHGVRMKWSPVKKMAWFATCTHGGVA